MPDLNAILDRLDQDRDAALERLKAFLRIESVSTDSAYKSECRKAAEWLAADLRDIGFDAELRDTPGHPMVVARSGGDGPRMLFYGHYDVQPVDPVKLWTSPPFEPVLEEGANGPEIRARGSSDDKGQLMTFVEACRAFKEVTGAPPANITMLFEGEEEFRLPLPRAFP